MNIEEELRPHIDDLLLKAGFTDRCGTIALCAAGGNNRIYKVKVGSDSYIVKYYFTHSGDSRDRLGAEYEFLSYSRNAAKGLTPWPYAYNRTTGLALYEYLDGRPFKAGEVGPGHVEDAIRFFKELNDPAYRWEAQSLPFSSEACFSLKEHLELVTNRLKRLMGIPQLSDEDRQVHQFLRQLVSYWVGFSEKIAQHASASAVDYNLPMATGSWCISPSDFGFHNALTGVDGSTYFIDFEYAGWDDPSRMVADFFCQIAVPVPRKYYNRFVEAVMAAFPEPEKLIQRSYLLLPVYGIKWCCIALNICLPVHLKRRLFANPQLTENSLKRQQLSKAKHIFETVQSGVNDGLH